MSLKTGKPPKKAFQIVSEAIQNLAVSSNEAMRAMGGTPEAAELTPPLQVYTLGLKDVLDGDLNKARETSWRYLILREDEPVGAAEVKAAKRSKVQFSHFNTGPFVEETVKAILQAESLDAVNSSDYEARILKIPALYIMALWLHSDSDDILIPMPPTNEKLVAKKTYTQQEFFTNLIDVAHQQLNFDDTPQ